MAKLIDILPEQNCRVITLTNGMQTLVDADLFEELNQYRWGYLSAGGYVVRPIRKPSGKRGTVFMHKVILPSPKGMVTDHINGDPLDNRRENLRVATRGGNVRNSRHRVNAVSNYKGVCYVRARGKIYYRASCWGAGVPQNKKHLGHFPTEEAAARAYDRRAWELFGEFARLNFPDEDPSKHPPIICGNHRYYGGKECVRCGTPVHAKYRLRKNGKDVRL